MDRLYTCMTQQHDLALVLLAAPFASLSLVNRAIHHEGMGRLAWLTAGATVSGASVWATHFIAMLAFDTGLPTGYDISLMILSLVIAIIVTALGFSLPTYYRGSRAALIGGTIVGAGIAAMHVTGMAGLLVPATMSFDYGLAALALLLGCGFAASAIRQTVVDPAMGWRAFGALQLTVAICSMHFTGMAALELTPGPLVPLPDAYLTADRLAINLGLAALVILVLSTGGALIDQHLAGQKALEAKRLHCLVNPTFEGIGICVDGRLVEANKALSDLLKRPGAKLQGQPFAGFVDPDQRDALASHLQQGGERVMELLLIPEPGPPVSAELMIRSIDYGGRRATVIAVRDITVRRAAQVRLENDRDHLEQLVAERTAELQSLAALLAKSLEEERKLSGLQRQFVSMVSREFRTPLAIIDGHAQSVLRRAESLSERAQSGLAKIRKAATCLTELMESVLAAARLEDGRIIYAPAPCALAGIIEEVAGSYADLNPDYKMILDLDRLPKRMMAETASFSGSRSPISFPMG